MLSMVERDQEEYMLTLEPMAYDTRLGRMAQCRYMRMLFELELELELVAACAIDPPYLLALYT